MTVTVFGLNQCSTCIKARKWLELNRIDYQFQDYRAVPVDAAVLTQWAQDLGGWEKLVNRASMTWRNLDASLKSPDSAESWLALIAQSPALIRRPVTVYADGSVTVGFNEKRYTEKFAVAG
jgi:Spx/MgsR family transcriptional regulator